VLYDVPIHCSSFTGESNATVVVLTLSVAHVAYADASSATDKLTPSSIATRKIMLGPVFLFGNNERHRTCTCIC
jgi:hypothetical protein